MQAFGRNQGLLEPRTGGCGSKETTPSGLGDPTSRSLNNAC